MRYYEFIVEYRGALDSLAKTYGQKILDKLKMVPERINSGYKGDADVGNDYETIAVRTLDQLNSEKRTAQNLPITSNHGDTEYENLTPEIYNEHKGAIVNRIIGTLAEYDPTEKKGYTQYILKWFLSDNYNAFPNVEDGESTLRQSLYDFKKMKGRLPERYRDINQYESAKTFMNSVQYFKEEYGKKEELPVGQYKIIYNDPKYAKAYWAVDEEAACYLGQGTQWCTASTRSTNYFDEYDAKGPLLIFHMKKEIKYNLQDNYEDDGGHFHMEYAEETKMFQVSLKVDSRGDWLFGDGDIAAPDDSEIDFADLYDYNSHFKAMYNTDEFIAAMTKVAREWWKTTDHVAGAWEYPQYNQDEH